MDDFDFFVSLYPHHNAAIFTLDGKMIKGIAKSEADLLKNADAIHFLMITAMKESDPQYGLWEWKIFDNWNAIMGWEI